MTAIRKTKEAQSYQISLHFIYI